MTMKLTNQSTFPRHINKDIVFPSFLSRLPLYTRNNDANQQLDMPHG